MKEDCGGGCCWNNCACIDCLYCRANQTRDIEESNHFLDEQLETEE